MSTCTATRSSRTSLLMLSAAAFWTVTLELLPAGLLPELRTDLGVGDARVGWLVGVWALTIAVTSLPLARATRRMPRPLVLGGSLGVVGVASLLTVLSPGFGSVLLGRFVSAAGHGLFWGLLVPYAVSVAPAGRESRAVSTVLAGPVLATLVGLPLGTTVAGVVGWRPVVGAVGLALLLGGVLLARTLPRGTQDDVGATGDGHGGADRAPTRWLVLAVLAASVTLVGHFAVFTYVSPLLTGPGAIAEDAVGPALLVFGAAGALGLVLSAGPAERRPWGTVLATMLGLGAALLLLAWVPGEWSTWVVVGLWGLCVGAFPAAQQGAVVRSAPVAFRGTAVALLVAAFNGGVALGATLGGLVLDGPGLTAVPVVGGALVLVSAGATLLAVRRCPDRRSQPGSGLRRTRSRP